MQADTYGPDGKIDIEPFVEKARSIGQKQAQKYAAWYSVEEVESFALAALVICRDEYEPGRVGYNGKVSTFGSYILWKIPALIVDQLREESWVPRLVLTRGEEPVRQRSLSELVADGGPDGKPRTLVDDLDDGQHKRMPHLDCVEEVEKELRRFNVQERTILRLYHGLDVPMQKIGRILGLSESRVSQMHSAIMARLKEIHDGPRSRDRAERGYAHCPRTRKTKRADGNGDGTGADPGEPAGGEPADAPAPAAEAAPG